ncbi:selenocysteine-specific translation elongation factor [Kocuria sp. cx-455]|uniref:selenocysteine-specific translation elongation factor n=1 Tax=Kocuria sp. cx-455 TaxID=2771377 RepID=UPI0016865038|nr:selenocysteine-specific translation elongation factor [Kocuria sp. cx-455]MBD2764504.1 selenocysteine-specific translation elongation factor [Kocuria sp. cx-455]
MYVVATAGHVDHGKSTLVRALTGMEPDRWAEEKQRGLTIDLGFAWTDLPSGNNVAFVDVPGHERFLGNMLAGLGPAPVVCFVVAVDEGWQAQSSDHRDALAALGIERGLIVLTKADRAPERVEAVTEQVRGELSGTGLRNAPVVAVSAQNGTGLNEFRAALDGVLQDVPLPDPAERLRLWVDRAFSVSGAGTVVTGTLTAGTVRVGDKLSLLGQDRVRPVTVRSVQSHNRSVQAIGATNRVAINMRGISAEDVHRGDALLTPDAWPTTGELDVRRMSGISFEDAPAEIMVHAGSASVPARLRPFDDDHARVQLSHELALIPGDRLVMRYPEARVLLGGARVLDVDPPELNRRGDSARHTQWLATLPETGDPVAETKHRGAVRIAWLHRLGLVDSGGAEPSPGEDITKVGRWWIHRPVLTGWAEKLRSAVKRLHERDPLSPGMTRGAAIDALALPGPELLATVIREAQLEERGGLITVSGRSGELGAAENAVARVEAQLVKNPFAVPEAQELTDLGLGPRELAAAERAGRLVRLADGVVVLPNAPALAMRELARLEQPFTTSQARQAWGTTRRVAIPLLEHLDARGWTRRLDGTARTVVH